MKTYCKDYLSKNHSNINLSKDISCCLLLLIEKYTETNNNSQIEEFSSFLLHTLNHHLKIKNYKVSKEADLFLNSEQISLSLFCKFIDILIHCSITYIRLNQIEYAKFTLSIGVDIINKSKFRNEKIIIKKKITLGNNISFVYLLNNNFIKAEKFLDKCKEKSPNNLNKMIIYNNCCIINVKNLKNLRNNKIETKKSIDKIIQYLNIIFNEINIRIENKYKSYINFNEYKIEKNKFVVNHKDELFCYLIFNSHKMMKTFIKKEFDKNYSKSFSFIQQLLGSHHFITLNMKRLDEQKNNSEFINLLLKENFNESKINQPNKDIISYIKKNGQQENPEKSNKKINLKIDKRINVEFKKNNLKKNIEEIKEIKEIKNNNDIIKGKIINNENKNKEENKKEIIIKDDKDLNENNKSNEEQNKKPKSIGQKKTWRGLFQTITGKKFPGQENKLGELFKTISESKNKIKKTEDIKSQYNEYHEEMESYLKLKEKSVENFFTFNSNYSGNYPENLFICRIDENDKEKNSFDKVAFEKSIQKETQVKHSTNFIINYFKNSIRKQIIFPELISDILDYDILEKMNNLYHSKKKNELSINKEIERIINYSNKYSSKEDQNNQLIDEEDIYDFTNENKKNVNNNKIETEFYLDSVKYKILYINDYENKKILINVNKSKSSQSKKDEEKESNELKSQISYEDINYYFSKYYLKNNYECCISLRYMQNINSFIQRMLIHYIRLIKVNDKLNLVFCKYPKGNFKKIYKKGRPQFTFLNEICTFEICKYSKRIELNIYNITYTSHLIVVFECDYSSESVFFQEKNKKPKNSKKISADFELNSNYKLFNRLANFFIKFEKICQFRDKSIKTFSEYVEKYKTNIHKVSANDSLINLDLWIISLQKTEIDKEIKDRNNNNNSVNNINIQDKKTKFQWNVELFTLTKLAIKNGSYYMTKNIILTPLDFENIIGCDYSDIYTIIDDKDNFFCLYFLLGTIQKMKHILIKMLNSSNYLTAFRLQKISPISFFKYKFVFKHIKRYFICSLEFLIYSRENFFLRIMVMETMSNRSYSKIYIPFYSINIEFDIKEMEKFLKQKYSVINSLYENKQKLKKFLLIESQNLLTKNSPEGSDALVLFENIKFLVDKIQVFLAENKY